MFLATGIQHDSNGVANGPGSACVRLRPRRDRCGKRLITKPIETKQRKVQVINPQVSRVVRQNRCGPCRAILNESDRSTDPPCHGLVQLELIGLAERQFRIPGAHETLSRLSVASETRVR